MSDNLTHKIAHQKTGYLREQAPLLYLQCSYSQNLLFSVHVLQLDMYDNASGNPVFERISTYHSNLQLQLLFSE